MYFTHLCFLIIVTVSLDLKIVDLLYLTQGNPCSVEPGYDPLKKKNVELTLSQRRD